MVETMQKQGWMGTDKSAMSRFSNSDASKVKAKGQALKKAHLHKQNQFNVSADEAGQFLNEYRSEAAVCVL